MIIAGTGHRPDKLGGYSTPVLEKAILVATNWLTINKPDTVISGMALGWDQALAIAAIRLKIPVTAAIPFAGQEFKWPAKSQDLYLRILNNCAEQVIVCKGGFKPASMQIRNEWMVDHADTILALWNGSSGGTANCVEFARYMKKPIINLWDKFNL